MTCTYTLTDKDGKEITLTGQSELKAYLVDGGLSHLYPDGNYPWVKQEQQAEPKVDTVSPDAEVETTTVNPANPIDAFNFIMQGLNEGTVSIDEYKKGFEDAVANKDSIVAELSKRTKDDLVKSFGLYLHKNEKKDYLVNQAYKSILSDFFISDDLLTYGMGKDSYVNAIRKNVESLTQDDLDSYAAKRKEAIAERKKEISEKLEGIKDPKTLDDFQNYMRVKIQEEKLSFNDARMTLTPEQRAKYDELVAEYNRNARSYRKERDTDYVATNRAETDAEIIKTVHTRDNYDLWVVKAAERVERDIYNDWNATAKKLGGWYSSFKGRGAIPGFQFKTEEGAQAFQQYISKGDTEAVQEQAKARRDAYQDDKTQSTVERLTEMADRLEESANESLNQVRKVNTARRAGMAANADAKSRSQIALAKTMRNIANAISSGKANFLDRVRQKVQVEFLQGMVSSAHYRQLMDETKGSYGEYEKRRYEAPTQVTADYAEFPSYSAYRSDLASLARQLVETEGTKQLGKDLLKIADDVSDAYLKFAKENLIQVGGFRTKDGGIAAFTSMKQAEMSIAASGYNGKAIPFKVSAREIIPILSPSEAQIRGIWKGDNDKRITLKSDFGNKLITALGKANRKQQKVSVPWQFERAHSDIARLQKMGIESPAEFRAALREFIDLKEQPEQEDKIKKLERSMVGRANDGLDFFPTPQSVADEMIAAAEIKEGMKVLEPSAGMGHIADQIRDAGVDPDVIELSPNRRELLEAKGHNIVANDFMDYNEGGYDRIIMNPPFSDRRDAAHVQHAYDLLKPGGRLVAIMGEGVFFGSDKKASSFMDWLDSVGGEHEKMAENTFMDKSLPVTTGVNTRMVVIEKPASSESTNDGLKYSKPVSVTNPHNTDSLTKALEKQLDAEYGQGWFNKLLATDKFKVIDRDEAKQYSANAVDAQGFYNPENDTTYFVADNIGKDDDLKGLALHEIGVHALNLGRNDAEFQAILKQLDVLKDKNAKVKAAYERIPKDTKPEHRLEELAAYIVQNEPSLSVSKRIIAWFKNALRNIAKYVKGADRAELIKWANTIDENDVVFMANAALKSAPDTLVFSNERTNDDIKYSKPADATEDNVLWPDEPNTENEWIDAVKTKLENLTDRAKVAAYGVFTVRQLSTLGKNIMPQLKGFSALLQKRESLQNRYKNESGRLVDNHWKKLDSKNAYRINTVINESTLYDIDSSREWTGIEKQDDVYVAYTQNIYSGPDQEKIKARAASLGGKLVGKTKAEFTSQKQAAIFISALRDYKPTLSDQERQKQHKLNYARFQSLPKDAQYIYRDAYRQHDDLFNAKMAALEKRISKAIFDEKKRSQFIATVRQQFESNRMNWYYAPLSRFGDYWLYGKIDGQAYFETFESQRALDRAKESFQGELIGSGRKIEDMRDNDFDSVGEGFIANIQSMLQEAEAPEELQDQVYQMFLETLPSVSMRKNSIHRQGIAGFDKDAMRAFSNSLWHGSKQLSNLLYNTEMSRLLSDAKKTIDIASSQAQVSQIEDDIEAAQTLLDNWKNYPLVALKNDLDNDPGNKVIESMISLRKKYETLDVGDREKRLKNIIKKNNEFLDSADKIRTQDNGPIQASKLVSEMNKAFEDMQKSDYSPLVQTAMQFNFVTMLGLSPAFFLVNTIQTPGVAMPRAYGRFGNLPKVMKIYGDSLADFMDAVVNRRKDEYGNWSLTATLTDKLAKAEQKGDKPTVNRLRQEIAAMDKFLKEGDVDKTQGYDLIGVAEEGAAHGGIMLKIAQTSGFLAHHSERMNREITLLSNFRLAREHGEGFRTAIDTARELNIDSHLDYSSENTARFMRSPSMKLITQFMKYKQGMYFLWFNSIHEAFKGASEADKKEGMRTAIGLVTMQTALAGTMGLPLMGALMTTLDLIGGMFDDDDDKWDTKKEIRLGLHKVLSPLGEVGDKLAESIVMGVVNGLTPVELHSRLDLSDVIFRDPIREMEGRDAGAYLVASMFGPTGGNVMDMYESVRLANDGLWARAVETFPLMPKFGADFLKAIRYGTEDARNQNDKLLKEMSKPEVILQALGLSSSNLSRKYDENSYTKNAERDITEARNKIIEKIAEGRIKGDMQLVAEGQREAQEWRTKHPEYPINAKSIRASIRARRRAEKNMQGTGIRVNPRLDYLRDENKIEG